MKPIILPYKMGSASARVLARALSTKRVYHDRHYKYKRNHLIINWGSSVLPEWHSQRVDYLNHPYSVAQAANKLTSYGVFNLSTIPPSVGSTEHSSAIPCPEWSIYRQDAIDWLEDGCMVYARKTLTGHSGQGIVVMTSAEEIIDAPLYTKRFISDKEYRVHVFNGRVIDYAKKGRKRTEEEDNRPSHLIRNYSKGWVFLREGIELPEVVKETSIRAVKALGLDFGAVDIATHRDDNNIVCCYEVNTACGLQGSTIQAYASAIRSVL